VIDDALGDEVRITVIAAGFDGGEPKKVQMPTISAAALSGQADPIAANDPIAVALDLGINENTDGIPTMTPPRRKITFEELVSEDEIDVPDFMK
jgi:cell division protein FtsZ